MRSPEKTITFVHAKLKQKERQDIIDASHENSANATDALVGPMGILGTGYTLTRARQIVIGETRRNHQAQERRLSAIGERLDSIDSVTQDCSTMPRAMGTVLFSSGRALSATGYSLKAGFEESPTLSSVHSKYNNQNQPPTGPQDPTNNEVVPYNHQGYGYASNYTQAAPQQQLVLRYLFQAQETSATTATLLALSGRNVEAWVLELEDPRQHGQVVSQYIKSRTVLHDSITKASRQHKKAEA